VASQAKFLEVPQLITITDHWPLATRHCSIITAT